MCRPRSRLVPSAAASCCETTAGQVSSRCDAAASDMAGFVRLAGGRAAGVTSMAARMHNPTRVLRRLRGGRRVQMCEAKGRSCCMSNSRVAFPCAGEHLVRLNSYLQRIYMFHRHPTSRDSTSAKHLRSTPTKRPSAKLRSPRHYVLTKRLPTKLPPCETTCLRNHLSTKPPKACFISAYVLRSSVAIRHSRQMNCISRPNRPAAQDAARGAQRLHRAPLPTTADLYMRIKQ